MFDVKQVDETVLEYLKTNVDRVKHVLETIKVEVPFFVAGGSVLGVVNKSNTYSDIDVYFKSEKDMNSVRTVVLNGIPEFSGVFDFDFANTSHSNCNGADFLVTDNAATQRTNSCAPVQLIFCSYGTPENVLNGFDFNVCRVAFSSNYEFITGKYFDVEFNGEVTPTGLTLSRFLKYTIFKQVKFCEKTLNSIIELPCKTPHEMVKCGYGEKLVPALQIINSVVWSSLPNYITQKITECVVKNILKYHKNHSAIKLLTEVQTTKYTTEEINNPPELTAAKLNLNIRCANSEIEICKQIYPELFV